MLYYLFYPLRDFFGGFNVFRYITFRAAGAAMTTFFLCLIFGPRIIRKLAQKHICEHVRPKDEVHALYDLHHHKQGTPTMGGLIMVGAVLLATVLWGDIKNIFVGSTRET